MPSEFLKIRNIEQCATCNKSHLEDGVTLRKCKACGTRSYCGKECQKADWPHHKNWCKVRAESIARWSREPLAAQVIEDMNALGSWISVHLLALQRLSFQELAIHDDPGKGATVLFAVVVHARREETDRRKAFEIVDAAARPFPHTGPDVELIRRAYDSAHANNSKRGSGTYVIAVTQPEPFRIPHIMPIGFKLSTRPLRYLPPAELIAMMNRGEVF